MPGVTIDRLSLRLSGLSEDDGRRLTRLIAEGLAATSLPSGCGHTDSAHVDSLQSKVASTPGASVQSLSELIVADVVRQLGRSI